MTTFTVDKSSLKEITGKTILITGGSSGIGLSTAELFHSLSNNVIVLDRAEPPASSLTSSARFLFQQCDITSWRAQRAAFQAGEKKFGHIDVVFVNAGIAEFEDQFFTDRFDEDGELAEPDRRVVDVDLHAADDTVKLAIHFLRKNKGGGSIVITTSLAGYLASAGAPLYSAAKHGVVGLMRALKNETAKLNIAISVVAPATTVTNILPEGKKTGQTPEQWAASMKKIGLPVNRAETVASAVGYLVKCGMEGNGQGVFVQADRMIDLEREIAKTRGVWMGQEMLDLFRAGRVTPVITNRL